MTKIGKITPNLWFDHRALEAVQFYTAIFENSKIGRITYYTDDGHEIHAQRIGSVMTVEFQIEGQDFVALNGGPQFKFNEAISFIVHCDSQEEVDIYWDALGEGGDPEAQQCGWLKDKFGVSWQIVPTALTEMVRNEDPERAGRVLRVMYPMKKLDIKTLQRAYDGE